MSQDERAKRQGDRGKGRGKRFREKEDDGFSEEVIFINRVSKVVKGGRKFGFSALVAVGDLDGKIGLGIGKAGEVLDAIRKGAELARKNIIRVPREGTTIPYELKEHFCATTIVMKPAREGTGIIAGGPARVVLKLAGISDISAKYIGSSNRINCAKAAFNALKKISSRKALFARRKWYKTEKEEIPAEPVEEVIHESTAVMDSSAEPVEENVVEATAKEDSPVAAPIEKDVVETTAQEETTPSALQDADPNADQEDSVSETDEPAQAVPNAEE